MTYRWAEYPGNSQNKLSIEYLVKLKELYDIGKKNKKQKVSAERAHQILIDTILVDKWADQLDVTVPKIKAFFSMNPAKQKGTIEQLSIEPEALTEAVRELVEDERNAEALSLVDLEMELHK
mmetsp:Transcript_4151/g.8033  ORF Transcript_4151/g.8033 Transcript_4151/m.8033 type:complete len:122 (-) Transcript_4151:72-437(-)